MVKVKKYTEHPKNEYGDVKVFPSHWNLLRLKYTCYLNPSKSEINKNGEIDVTFLPMENILSSDIVDLSIRKPLIDVYTGYTYFRDGDIVIAKVTPCFENGNIALLKGLCNGIGFGTTELHVVRMKSEYSKRFFFYIFQSDRFRQKGISSMYGVAGLKRIPTDFLENFIVAVPSLEEQISIAFYLDKKSTEIDSLITDKEKLIILLEEQRQTAITEAVTNGLNPDVKMKDSGVDWIGEIPEHWNYSKLKYSGNLTNGFAFPSNKFTDNGIRVMKIANIQPMNIDWSDESFINEKYYSRLTDYRVHKDDLVFALTRPIITSGIKAAIVNTDEKILLNQRNALYRSGPNLISSWLYYILLHNSFIQVFESCIDGTGQQPNISSTDIENIEIPIPTLKEQQQIVDYLNQKCLLIDKVIAGNHKIIKKLKEYRQSLIYEAVTGKIDVREYAEIKS